MSRLPPRPVYPKDLKAFIRKSQDIYNKVAGKITVSAGARGIVRKYMGDVLNDEDRHLLIGWLFYDMPVPMSTNACDDAAIVALQEWIGAELMDDVWIPNKHFAREARWMADEAKRDYVKSKQGV